MARPKKPEVKTRQRIVKYLRYCYWCLEPFHCGRVDSKFCGDQCRNAWRFWMKNKDEDFRESETDRANRMPCFECRLNENHDEVHVLVSGRVSATPRGQEKIRPAWRASKKGAKAG